MVLFKNLMVGPRPTPALLRAYRNDVDIVVTLQKPEEHPEIIKTFAQKNDLLWEWVPLDARGGAVPQESKNWELAARLVHEYLKLNRRVLVHCAAGIHRAGLVVYFVYRLHGLSHEEAERAVYYHRPPCKGELADKLPWAKQQFAIWGNTEGGEHGRGT